MTVAGVVTVIAGQRDAIGSADGKGSEARFRYPQGIALAADGSLYVADTGNDMIRRITTAGMVSTVAGKVMTPGAVDGAGNDARFNYPCDIAVDGTGALYVADFYNFLIRKVSPDGLVTTLAGRAGESRGSDGTSKTARFESPAAIAVDRSGNVYVSDTVINCIRKIDSAGRVSTIAGQPSYIPGSANGRGSAAQFSHPFGLAADAAGNIYVADLENHAIRRVTPDGTVATLAGYAGEAGKVGDPFRMALDGAGNLYVTDLGYLTIRKGTLAGGQ